MRNVTIYFIFAETLDLITTMIGLRLGMTETNPLVYRYGWDAVILVKILITIGLSIVLEKKKEQPIDILLPWIAILPVIWNSLMIVLTW